MVCQEETQAQHEMKDLDAASGVIKQPFLTTRECFYSGTRVAKCDSLEMAETMKQ